MLKIIPLLALIVLHLGAAEETKEARQAKEAKLPAAIQSLLEKAEKEATKNRAAYDDANKKTFDGIEKSLKGELEKLTKAGKLDEAVAVKKVLDGFRAEIGARVDADAKAGTGGKSERSKSTGSEAEMTKMLVGKNYLMNGEVKDQLTFLANGVIDLPSQWTDRNGATWSYTDKFTITIKANTDTYVLKFNEDYRTYVSLRNGITTESGVVAE